MSLEHRLAKLENQIATKAASHQMSDHERAVVALQGLTDDELCAVARVLDAGAPQTAAEKAALARYARLVEEAHPAVRVF